LSTIAQSGTRLGKAKGIRFLAFEEGYLRPHFITLEEGGVNAFSPCPAILIFTGACPISRHQNPSR
jgi:capsule polysaccharide modification protein KpsS